TAREPDVERAHHEARKRQEEAMTGAERVRLARILGMLGSEHAGERASAALQAEAFRKRHGLTWEAMLALPEVAPEPVWTPPPEPRPTPPPPPSPRPPSPPP